MARSLVRRWEQSLPVIQERTASFARSYQIERSDLESLASEVFVRASKKWRRDSSFPTFLNRCLTNSFHNYCQREARGVIRDPQDFRFLMDGRVEATETMDMVSSLSTEARQVCGLALEETSPCLCPREMKREIVRELRARKWTWKRIWNTFKEIREALNDKV